MTLTFVGGGRQAVLCADIANMLSGPEGVPNMTVLPGAEELAWGSHRLRGKSRLLGQNRVFLPSYYFGVSAK